MSRVRDETVHFTTASMRALAGLVTREVCYTDVLNACDHALHGYCVVAHSYEEALDDCKKVTCVRCLVLADLAVQHDEKLVAAYERGP